MAKRVTHRAEVEFDLDPGISDAAITILAQAEQTAEGTEPFFNRVNGDADPGGPDEFDTDLYVWDTHRQRWEPLQRRQWEVWFGKGTFDNLLEFMEGELEKV
jgi:hypothetical protein